MINIVFSNSKPYLFSTDWSNQLEVNDWLYSLRNAAETRSPETWRNYAYDLGGWLNWCEIEKINWRTATRADTEKYIRSTKGDATANRHLATLVKFYNWAKDTRAAARFPFSLQTASQENLSRFTNRRRRHARTTLHRRLPSESTIQVPRIKEVWRFKDAATCTRDKLLVETFAFTGLRISEAISLRKSTFDLLTLTGTAKPVKVIGKGAKPRIVLFPNNLVRDIKHWIDLERCFIFGASKTDQLFIGRRGTLGPTGVERLFRKIGNPLNVQVYPHLLRHFFACHRLKYLTDAGLAYPLGQLQKELGHSSIQTTSRYLHLTDELRAKIAEEHQDFILAISSGHASEESKICIAEAALVSAQLNVELL